ncbi:hypothetical protein [Streptococcus parasanguinis]|uniref:hypothetical protein n=1 Tax=Streptococcus parasanguinis TaxID=1318 RepID=UPI00189CD5A8|nr:hypothetical protein [Streptococcus parasanguinis]
MNESTYIAIITDLANQLANKTINEAEFKARLTKSQEHVAQLVNKVESYRSVLESDKDLKDLFEEIKNKNEVTN